MGMGRIPPPVPRLGPAAAYMLEHDIMESGKYGWIEQGIEIMRPSMIRVKGTIKDGSIGNIRVAGRCFPIAEGKLSVPP
jgi:Predicted epimerase, PhzC/PhzF homolog